MSAINCVDTVQSLDSENGNKFKVQSSVTGLKTSIKAQLAKIRKLDKLTIPIIE